MLIKPLKNLKLKSELKNFLRQNNESLIDIILFGSSLKGKDSPKDLDIILLFKEKRDINLSYALSQKIKKLGLNPEIVDKTYNELFQNSFIAREAILSEGFSIKNEKFIANGLGYIIYFLFRYDLKNFNKSQRMRFYYALYGRNNNLVGVLTELKAVKFSDTVILCPLENVYKMKSFFENLKINFVEFPIIIPERIKNILN